MYNLRYHIASMVAVFLALAVGLLLGTVVVERGMVSRQRAALVEGLQADFTTIRETNDSLEKQNEQMNSFAAEAYDALARDALKGRTVVVLADPSRGDAVAKSVEAVKGAGGSAVVASFAGAELGLTDKGAAKSVSGLLNAKGSKDLAAGAALALAREWASADAARPVTKALTESGRLSLEGLRADTAVSGVVVAGTLNGKPDPTLLTLAEAMRASGISAAGVESTKRPTGMARAAAEKGMSAVDDVDLPLGRLSLTWILAKRASGHFGVGEDADYAYPKPLFPAD